MPQETSPATPSAKPRRWYQFSLRTLIIVMMLIQHHGHALPSGWIERPAGKCGGVYSP
jgi:hypothetical protein